MPKVTFDLIDILKTLAVRRPVFHSEANFQHALAWIIHGPGAMLSRKARKHGTRPVAVLDGLLATCLRSSRDAPPGTARG